MKRNFGLGLGLIWFGLALVSSCGFVGQPMNPVVQTHTACGLC